MAPDQVDQLEIRPINRPVDAEIQVPGSKSITNRALLLAALADGTSTLENALFSEDSHWCAECLRRLGIAIEEDEPAERFTIHGLNGVLPATSADLFVGNSGTTARFITAAATLGHGEYNFDGVARMRQRPIGNLLKALRPLGANFTSDNDCFPLTVHANGLRGGATELDATESSQLLSALLQVAAYAENDVTINVTGTVVSVPYIDITLKMMAQFGIAPDNHYYRNYSIKASQRYRAQRYIVEPDASNATYFFAAAALTKGRVRVPHLSPDSLQGDAHFVDVLEQMGCTVTRADDYLEVQGPDRLKGIEIDLNAMSDTAQTLAAIAPFASSPVTIRNVEHMRHKETDRINAIVTELRKLGVRVDEFPDGVTIYPAYPSAVQAAAIDTYNDHRMAMAFSVIGLVVPGIRINDPGCTRKTFPDFFARFEKLYDLSL
ncbi:MAG: 3-phosphoshikimate 1-carboxyvinyltransferase [Chloroflexota bacterium]